MKDLLKESLGPKLVLIVVGGLVVLNSLTTWYNLYVQDRGVIRILEMSGNQVSSIVAGAAKEGMLRNDREAIQRTVDTLGRQYEISAIRISDAAGKIAYSSSIGEVGGRMDTSTLEPKITKQEEASPGAGATRVLELLTPVRNETECVNAPCHAHKAGDKVLGYLQVQVTLDPFDKAKRQSAVRLAAASFLGILLTALLAFVVLHKFVHKPIRELMGGVREVANGNLSVRVPEFHRDELGQLAKSFNRMSSELHKAHVELVDWAQTLEFRVTQKTEELERAQAQILQVEKMASLGRLAAVVAHEINNPLASVVTYAKLIVKKQKARDSQGPDCQENLKYLEAIVSEAQRCGDIVSQLLSFARNKSEKFEECNLEEIARKAIFILHHKLELSQVEAKTVKFGDIPHIQGDASQIQQAFMALMINSCEAMEKGGLIAIKFAAEEGFVRVLVEDSGPGMESEVAKRVFEPFFTTKTNGSGAGLGLSVVYSIIMRHNGRIHLETAPGKGARFVIDLPIVPVEGKE